MLTFQIKSERKIIFSFCAVKETLNWSSSENIQNLVKRLSSLKILRFP